MPVLLGGGLRIFENLADERIQLERIKVMEFPTGERISDIGSSSKLAQKGQVDNVVGE